MTLIEFTIKAKKIVDDAGLGPCAVTCASDMRIGADGKIEYQHKVTAHPASGMLTSYDKGFDYYCNNPALALERFQIAVDRRLAPPSEPEAITEIEGLPVYQVTGGDVSAITLTKEADVPFVATTNEPSDYQVHALWDYCTELKGERLDQLKLRKDFTSVEGSRRLAMFSIGERATLLFSIVLDLEGLSYSSKLDFADVCKAVGIELESEVGNG